MSCITITRENFEEAVLHTTNPVLLDFWAPWCGPCKQITPILEQIAAERKNITIGKVNVDSDMELAQQFRIVSIPTLILIKDGKITEKAVGFRSREEILKLLDK